MLINLINEGNIEVFKQQVSQNLHLCHWQHGASDSHIQLEHFTMGVDGGWLTVGGGLKWTLVEVQHWALRGACS